MPETPPSDPEKFYVTTPIYYVNARPHIGHAYTTIAADVLARRHRLLGDDTFFLTGTDEHGQKIERSARAAGIDPQLFADGVSASFRELWERMGILNDSLSQGDPLLHRDFIRTTEPRHKERVQHLFRELQSRGAIYKSNYTGQYCVHDEAYVDGPPGVRCPDCGRTTETVSEENYYFRLSAFQQPLLDLLEPGPSGEPPQLQIQPDSRRNEVLSFIRGGLRDLSISRTSFTWGIPVPDDPKHVIYVWLDALANYMTAIGYGSSDPADQALFDKFWPADLHLVGKEIIRFHCVYWPAFLLALNPAMQFPAGADEQHPASKLVILSEAQRDEPHPQDAVILSEAQRAESKDLRPAPGPPQDSGATSATIAAIPAERPSTLSSRTEPSPNEGAAGRPAGPQAAVPLAVHKQWAAKMLPKAVTAHGWLLFEESKMSKSRGNIVRTETILDAFGDHYGAALTAHQNKLATNQLSPSASLKGTASAVPSDTATNPASAAEESSRNTPPRVSKHDADLFAADVLRYFLLREIPFGQDGSFSFDALIERYNADLANGYGNLVSRTLSMIEKYREGRVPQPPQEMIFAHTQSWDLLGLSPSTSSSLSEIPPAMGTRYLIDKVEEVSRKTEHFFQTSALGFLLLSIDRVTSNSDAYITVHAPWKLAKDASASNQLDEVLYTAAEAIRILTALLYPILPYTTAKVWAQLGLGSIEDAARNGGLRNLQWGGLQPGTRLGPLASIFPRAPKELAQIMTDTEANSPRTPARKETPDDDLTRVTADRDAATSGTSEFAEAPLRSASATPTESARHAPQPSRLSNELLSGTPAEPSDPWSPAAPPRTSGFSSENPIAEVGGSTALDANVHKTPPHAEASASGLFASPASATPVSADGADTAAFAPQITIDDFIKVDLRVARIVVAERIPKADKLLRLEVELGPPENPQRRQILSGIAEWYTPEELLGRRIIVIANLAPRTMRGLESHGMLLAASYGEHRKPILATFADSDHIPPGARLK